VINYHLEEGLMQDRDISLSFLQARVEILSPIKQDGFVKSPSAALRFTFVVAAYCVSTPHSSGFARLVRLRRRAFYFTIPILTFYEIIKQGGWYRFIY